MCQFPLEANLAATPVTPLTPRDAWRMRSTARFKVSGSWEVALLTRDACSKSRTTLGLFFSVKRSEFEYDPSQHVLPLAPHTLLAWQEIHPLG